MFGRIAAEAKGGAFTRMMSAGSPSLVALVALVCALAQPATSQTGLAISLAFGHDDDGHSHAVSMEADAGHFDLVLSHEHSAGVTGAGAGAGREPQHPRSCSEPDHVVHLGDEAPSCRSSRPQEPDAAPLAAVTCEFHLADPAVRGLVRASTQLPLAANLLRTVVLRL